MKKIYYKLHLKLLSPLAVGSGSGDIVDSAVAVDALNRPYIPASTLAGFLRAKTDENVRYELFGKKEGAVQSLVYMYDAVPVSAAVVTVRDSVALTENKISKKGAKFDFEAVETGAEFLTHLELHDPANYEQTVDALLVAAQKFSIGAKTTRGYGEIEITSAEKIVFDMSKKEDVEAWLAFDLFKEFDKNAAQSLCLHDGTKSDDVIRWSVRLRLVGALTIRKYTTGYLTDENGKAKKNEKGKTLGDADFEQLTLKNNTPVVPGTSWAGAFRHHMLKLASELDIPNASELIDWLFGYVDEATKNSQKSKIFFHESQLTGATKKVISRTSIDRFTGGSADTALFTEKVYYGGETELSIDIQKANDRPESAQLAMQLLFLALADLNNGLLAIGGQTSVGSGLFEIQSMEINGRTIDVNFERCHADVIREVLK